MTTWSAIEINNDSLTAIRDVGQQVADLLARAEMFGSDAAWDKQRPYKIRCIVERYPTEAAKVLVGEREIVER